MDWFSILRTFFKLLFFGIETSIRKKRCGSELIAIQNVRGICNKEAEHGKELKVAKIDLAIIPEK
jgi:hypothetical protein